MICINSIRFVRFDEWVIHIQVTGNCGDSQKSEFTNKSIGKIYDFNLINPIIGFDKPIGCNLIAIILTNLTYLKSPQLNDINGFIDIHLEAIPK
jgi:hypothetical protein